MKPDSHSGKRKPRPSINVHFMCCSVYAKIYLNHDGTAFAGHCPRCAKPIRIEVGPGGSGSKFWTVG